MSLLSELTPGEIFDGRYRIESLLGRGGFAFVYLATQVNIDRPVALKIMGTHTHDEGAPNATQLQRFEFEARYLSQLQSPNILTLLDFGITKQGQPYIVSEFIAGETLAEHLSLHGAIDEAMVCVVLEQMLRGLLEVHQANLLHRDVKPANIMLRQDAAGLWQATLLDFGIAKYLGQSSLDLTGDRIIGTLRYMAPEQIDFKQESLPSTDLYALGLVAYEMLTGSSPIDSTMSVQVIAAQLSDESFTLPQDLEVSPKLRAIVHRMIHKDLAHRYTSAQEVLKDLKSSDAVVSTPRSSSPAKVTSTAPEVETTERVSVKNRGWPLALMMALVLVVLAGLGVTLSKINATQHQNNKTLAPLNNLVVEQTAAPTTTTASSTLLAAQTTSTSTLKESSDTGTSVVATTVIMASPSQATILVNGAKSSSNPLVLESLKLPATIKVTARGYRAVTRTIREPQPLLKINLKRRRKKRSDPKPPPKSRPIKIRSVMELP